MPWTDPKKRKEYQRQYLARPEVKTKTRARNREYMRAWWAKEEHRTTANERRRRLKFGLSEIEYAALFAASGGVCAVCKQPPRGKKNNSKLHIDHDHQTGKVRGLLCHHCNCALGNAFDNPDRLRALADYLLRNT